MDRETNRAGGEYPGRSRLRRSQMKSYHSLSLALLTFAAAQVLTPCVAESRAPEHTFAIGTNDFLLDNQRFEIRCGEIHAARVPREYWRQRFQKAKGMGFNPGLGYL